MFLKSRYISLFFILFLIATSFSDQSNAGVLRDRIKERMAERGAVNGTEDSSAEPSVRLEGIREKMAQKRGDSASGHYTKTTIAGLDVAVWSPAGQGVYPLVIFSHGFGGCNTQSKFLMDAMASAGYLVVAPNHDDSKCGRGGSFGKPDESFKTPEAWSDNTYVNRKNDIINLMNGLRSAPGLQGKIDWSRVALSGHSLGGYTVIGLAGGWSSWKIGGIKAVLALSPYCSPYVTKGNLSGINVPVMYQSGTRDFAIAPYIKKPGGAYDKTPSDYYVEFDGAGHFAFTDAKSDFHESINYYSVAFLNAYVKGNQGAISKLSNQLDNVSVIKSK
jgi:predicted dienelactone hydrolase